MKINDNTIEELGYLSVNEIFRRIFIVLIGNILGFILLYKANIGISIDTYPDFIIFIIIVIIINSILWIFLTNFFMPFLIYTLGFGTFILNGLTIYLTDFLFPGINLSTFAIYISPLVLAILTTILSTILTVNDDSSYYRAVFRDSLKRKKRESKNYPGMIIIEIDGLSEKILNQAISKGYMPTLQKWVNNGSHKIKKWETDLSSQTGASQAGILHGNNENLVAFRWVEKENNNKIVVSTGFSDAQMIEKRISDGNGLLCENGASRSNLFSGDAKDIIFTYSQMFNLKGSYNSAWYAVYSQPNNFPRILILFILDIFVEILSQIKHFLKRIEPRMHRPLTYIPTRAFANVFMREVTTQTLIGDMIRGDFDATYATFIGYDEVAHHSGIDDEDVWTVLKDIDDQIYRLEIANQLSNRNYQFVIQSDHGQENGNTFKQRYGIKFENLVKSFLPEDMEMFSDMSSNEDHFKGRFVPHNHTYEKIKSKYKNSLEYVKSHKPLQRKNKKISSSEVIVLASGNLSLIYLTQWEKRLTYPEIVGHFPDLIPGLVNHEGVGFILVNSEKSGGMVIGKEGIYYLDKDIFEGENPLKNFGKNAAKHLKRTNNFKNVPDILVNSFYDPESGEICAFEELIGSHGGLGGNQSKPFIMYPSNWNIDDDLVGAESIYKLLKNQIEKNKL